jgi:hypothetical protein
MLINEPVPHKRFFFSAVRLSAYLSDYLSAVDVVGLMQSNGDKETVTFHMHVIRSNIRVWSCFVQVGASSMHDSMILYGMFSMDPYLDTS